MRDFLRSALTKRVRYMLGGVLFGLCFPMLARALPTRDMVLWVVYSAPLVLGAFSYFLGIRAEQAESAVQADFKTLFELFHNINSQIVRWDGRSPLFRQILEAICRNLGASVGAVWLIDERREQLAVSEFWSAKSVATEGFERATRETRFAPGVGLPGSIYSSGAERVISSIDKAENFPRRPMALRSGLTCGFGFPVTIGDQVIGVFEVYYDRRVSFDEALLSKFRLVGQQIAKSQNDLRLREELFRANSELTSQNDFVGAVLANLPNMVFVKEYVSGMRFKHLNAAGERLLGLKQADLIGKNDHDFFPKEQADFFLAKDMEVFQKRKPVRIDEEPINTPSGKRTLRTYKVPTFHADGTPDLLIGISEDITDELASRKALEEERARALQGAKMASLGEMSASIAHEINNPLSILVTALEILERDIEHPEKARARIESVKQGCNRIEKIVKGLRKFARTTDSTDQKPASLRQILDEVAVMVGPQAKRFDVSLEIKVEPEILISCNDIEIAQVFVNLINNAVDAVKHLRERWVRVRAHAEGGDIVVCVVDSGSGVPLEVQKKLFQPLFTTKPVGEGTGLGLSITRKILVQHQATIELDPSSPNTCFEIRFPKADRLKKAA